MEICSTGDNRKCGRWEAMKPFQNWLATDSSIGSDISTRCSSKPYFEKTPANERSATNTGRWPRSRQLWAMPTQLSAGPKAASGKKIVLLEQGPRFTEADRANMLRQSKETLNDFADYNDDIQRVAVTPNSSARPGDHVVEWSAVRLFGVGGSALHFWRYLMLTVTTKRDSGLTISELWSSS